MYQKICPQFSSEVLRYMMERYIVSASLFDGIGSNGMIGVQMLRIKVEKRAIANGFWYITDHNLCPITNLALIMKILSLKNKPSL